MRFPSTKRAFFSGGKFEGKIEGKITGLTFPILIALLMEEKLGLADSLHSQNARERNSSVVARLCQCLESKVNNARIVTISLTNLNMCCLSLDPQIVLVKNQHFCVNSLKYCATCAYLPDRSGHHEGGLGIAATKKRKPRKSL